MHQVQFPGAWPTQRSLTWPLGPGPLGLPGPALHLPEALASSGFTRMSTSCSWSRGCCTCTSRRSTARRTPACSSRTPGRWWASWQCSQASLLCSPSGPTGIAASCPSPRPTSMRESCFPLCPAHSSASGPSVPEDCAGQVCCLLCVSSWSCCHAGWLHVQVPRSPCQPTDCSVLPSLPVVLTPLPFSNPHWGPAQARVVLLLLPAHA